MYPEDSFGSLPNVHYINWPEYEGESSLREIAEKIIKLHKLSENIIVGGSSLGGMVAIEMAKILGCPKVILIGSATALECLQPIPRRALYFPKLAPIGTLQFLLRGVDRYLNNLLINMFTASNGEFIKAMSQAILHWEGLGDFQGQIHQIHGEKDRIILPPVENGTIIPGGGHVISLSHSKEVASFIYDIQQKKWYV